MRDLIIDLTCRNVSFVVVFALAFKIMGTVLVLAGEPPMVFFR